MFDIRLDELDVIGIQTDVTSQVSVDELARGALDAFGAIHVVCNNAGVAGPRTTRPVWELSDKEWKWVFGVNFWGVVNGLRTFLPIMLGQNEEGHLVNTASVAGLIHGGGGSQSIYSATKHSVLSLTESLHADLRERGAKISASVLCPGMVRTGLMESTSEIKPEGLSDADDGDADALRARQAMATALFEQGIAPSEVADLVVEAVKEDKFYILPHSTWDEVVRARTESILARGEPDRSVAQRLMESGRQL